MPLGFSYILTYTESVCRCTAIQKKLCNECGYHGDFFVFQLEGCFPDSMSRCAELLNNNIDVDFVDINSGCPIDLVYKKVYTHTPWKDTVTHIII